MNKQNVYQIFLKEVKALGRDKIRLFFLIFFPIMLMAIFMLAFGGSNTTKLGLAVVNLDNVAGKSGTWSTRFIGNLSAQEVLDVKIYSNNESAQADLQQGKISGIVIIPQNFSASCASFYATYNTSSWVNATVQFYADKGSAFASQSLAPVLQQVLLSTLFGQGNVKQLSVPVQVKPAGLVSSNTQIDARQGLVSGMLIYSVFLNVMTFSQSTVQDREKGVLKRYQMSRATSGDILLGQTFGSMVTAATQVVLLVATGMAFGFNPVGGIGGLASGILVACLFALFAIGLGLVIGVLVKTEGAATGASLSIVMCVAFFSGLFIPLEIMPTSLQAAATVFPSYYANDAVRSLVARGASLLAPQILLDIAIIFIFSGLVFILGWLAYRRKYA
ncbi:MAG TPA: ABC transporter permease [Candidatus Lokiarchaeia archaeon]|nr:ABC transporter permease [Candidatus Lokiarchaeia archaeon]